MDNNKKVLIGLGALGVVGATVLFASNAFAKPLSGDAFVLKMLKTVGFKKLPAGPPGIVLVDPNPNDTTGQKLYDWVVSEQKSGKSVLISEGYYKGTMAVSPSYLVSCDARFASFYMTISGFKVLPTYEPATQTGAMVLVGAEGTPPQTMELYKAAGVAGVAGLLLGGLGCYAMMNR